MFENENAIVTTNEIFYICQTAIQKSFKLSFLLTG